MNRPPKRVLGALAIVTGCSLTFQVALTRTLAAMLAYHYGFLAISLSLLGIGAAGLYVYVRPAWFERRSLEGSLATWSLVYAGTDCCSDCCCPDALQSGLSVRNGTGALLRMVTRDRHRLGLTKGTLRFALAAPVLGVANALFVGSNLG